MINSTAMQATASRIKEEAAGFDNPGLRDAVLGMVTNNDGEAPSSNLFAAARNNVTGQKGISISADDLSRLADIRAEVGELRDEAQQAVEQQEADNNKKLTGADRPKRGHAPGLFEETPSIKPVD